MHVHHYVGIRITLVVHSRVVFYGWLGVHGYWCMHGQGHVVVHTGAHRGRATYIQEDPATQGRGRGTAGGGAEAEPSAHLAPGEQILALHGPSQSRADRHGAVPVGLVRSAVREDLLDPLGQAHSSA